VFSLRSDHQVCAGRADQDDQQMGARVAVRSLV